MLHFTLLKTQLWPLLWCQADPSSRNSPRKAIPAQPTEHPWQEKPLAWGTASTAMSHPAPGNSPEPSLSGLGTHNSRDCRLQPERGGNWLVAGISHRGRRIRTGFINRGCSTGGAWDTWECPQGSSEALSQLLPHLQLLPSLVRAHHLPEPENSRAQTSGI